MKNVNDIAREIESLICKGVDSRLEINGTPWRIKYEELTYFIQQYKDDAEELYKASKIDGLTAGAIEAEGAFRMACIIQSKVDSIASYDNDSDS